jgi:hypothetical protein
MPRFAAYFVLILAISLPAVLLARTFMDSDVSRIEQLMVAVEDQGLSPWLDGAALEGEGVVLSAGSETRRFHLAQRSQAQAWLNQMTGIDGAQEVRIRQQQVTVREPTATVVLNLQLGVDEYVSLRLSLQRVDDQWVIERIRVMS